MGYGPKKGSAQAAVQAAQLRVDRADHNIDFGDPDGFWAQYPPRSVRNRECVVTGNNSGVILMEGKKIDIMRGELVIKSGAIRSPKPISLKATELKIGGCLRCEGAGEVPMDLRRRDKWPLAFALGITGIELFN